MTEKLKPCPFCGGEAEIHTSTLGVSRLLYLECKKCRVTGASYSYLEDAIEAWNTRYQEADNGK